MRREMKQKKKNYEKANIYTKTHKYRIEEKKKTQDALTSIVRIDKKQ